MTFILKFFMIKLGDKMNTNTLTIIIIISFAALYCFYKYIFYQRRINKMKEVSALCTGVLVRRTYNKKYYLYSYTMKYKKEEVPIADKMRLPIFQKRIKINEKYKMYVNPHNTEDFITPIDTLTYKWYLYAALSLLIIALLLFI